MLNFSLSAALSFRVKFYVLCQCYDESIFAVVLGALLGFFTGSLTGSQEVCFGILHLFRTSTLVELVFSYHSIYWHVTTRVFRLSKFHLLAWCWASVSAWSWFAQTQGNALYRGKGAGPSQFAVQHASWLRFICLSTLYSEQYISTIFGVCSALSQSVLSALSGHACSALCHVHACVLRAGNIYADTYVHMPDAVSGRSFRESLYRTVSFYYHIASPTRNLSTASRVFVSSVSAAVLQFQAQANQLSAASLPCREPSALIYTHQLFITTLDVYQSQLSQSCAWPSPKAADWKELQKWVAEQSGKLTCTKPGNHWMCTPWQHDWRCILALTCGLKFPSLCLKGFKVACHLQVV